MKICRGGPTWVFPQSFTMISFQSACDQVVAWCEYSSNETRIVIFSTASSH